MRYFGDYVTKRKRSFRRCVYVPNDRVRAMLNNDSFIGRFATNTSTRELLMVIDPAEIGFYAALRENNKFWYYVSVQMLGNESVFDRYRAYRPEVVALLKK